MYCIVLYCTVLVNIVCAVLYAYNCTVLYGIECTITHCTLYAIVLVNLNNGGPLGFHSGFIGQDIQRNDDDVQTVVTSKAKSKNWGWPSSSGVSKPVVEQPWSCFGAALFEISLHPIICYLLHLARLPVVLLWHWLHQSEAAHSHWLQLNLHVQVAPLLLGCIALMSLFIWWGGGVKFRQNNALKFDTVSYKYWTFQVHHPIKTLCFSVSYLFLCDFGFYIPITQVLNIEAVYICINKM